MIYIPTHWAKATETVQMPDASSRVVSAWGWSESSWREAESHAHRRLADLIARLRRGEELWSRYGYGSRPLREEVLQRIDGGVGELSAVLTRNAYGCVVINAARTLFVDIDLPPATLRDRLRSLLGLPAREAETLQRLRAILQRWNRGSFRVYRTAAGFRVLATDPPFDPVSADAERLMEELGADPAFLQLCRTQRSFRARVTPKPWRCGWKAPADDFPRDTADAQERFARWLAEYDRRCSGKAACRFIEAVGHGRVHPEIALVLCVHDDRSGADRDWKLA